MDRHAITWTTILSVAFATGCSAPQEQSEDPAGDIAPDAEPEHPGDGAHNPTPQEQSANAQQCPEQVFEGHFSASDGAALAQIERTTVVTGDLYITDMDGVADLPFRCLREVGGALVLGANRGLTSLNGLSRLTTTGGRLDIAMCGDLTSVDGLGSLTSVGGSVNIESTGVRSLEGLTSLTSVGSAHVYVLGNVNLPTCQAEAFVAQLQSHGWSGQADIRHNNDSATCN